MNRYMYLKNKIVFFAIIFSVLCKERSGKMLEKIKYIVNNNMLATKKQLEGLKSRVCKNTMVADHQWCLFCPFSVVDHDDNEICTMQHTIDKLEGMIEREGVADDNK